MSIAVKAERIPVAKCDAPILSGPGRHDLEGWYYRGL